MIVVDYKKVVAKPEQFKMLLALLLACVVLACTFAACDKPQGAPPLDKYEPSYDFLIADEYRDLASEVRLNTAEYPELARQGLRLVTGYDASDYAHAKEGAADDVEVIRRHFDPSKGILVLIHGLQMNSGRNRNTNMTSENRLGELELFGDENEIDYFASDANGAQTYDLAKYWMDNGYNVFYFHWEMFADYYKEGGLLDMGRSPIEVQERIWTRDTGVQAVYVRGGKTYMTEPNKAVNGSVAEWLATDYLRMAAAVSEAFPNYGEEGRDVRFAGHSMGGVLTVASSALLNLLCEDGKLDARFAPNRLALMDSYLGSSASTEYTVAWSGKKYAAPTDSLNGCNYIPALDMLVNRFGVAAEFICNEEFLIPFLLLAKYNETLQGFEGENAKYANKIFELCPIVLVRPYFAGVSLPIFVNGHNAIMEWYLSTILYDAPKADGRPVPTARMSNEEVRAARRNFFMMDNERMANCETVRCDDDIFYLNAADYS